MLPRTKVFSNEIHHLKVATDFFPSFPRSLAAMWMWWAPSAEMHAPYKSNPLELGHRWEVSNKSTLQVVNEQSAICWS